MVIQRWQTLLLLIAVALMCVFCLTPFATIPETENLAAAPTQLFVKDAPVFMILNVTIALLLFLAILSYLLECFGSHHDPDFLNKIHIVF